MYSCITPYFVQKVVQPDLLCASLETQWCRDGATARVASRWCSAACCSSPRKSSRSWHRGRTSPPGTPWCSRSRQTAPPRATSPLGDLGGEQLGHRRLHGIGLTRSL